MMLYTPPTASVPGTNSIDGSRGRNEHPIALPHSRVGDQYVLDRLLVPRSELMHATATNHLTSFGTRHADRIRGKIAIG